MAKDGDDFWSGKLASPNPEKTDGPFASLSWALATMKSTPVCGGKVLLREGVYRFEKTLELWPGNSGTKERPLMIAAFPGEKVVIDGGVPIAGAWTKVGDGPQQFCGAGAKRRIVSTSSTRYGVPSGWRRS